MSSADCGGNTKSLSSTSAVGFRDTWRICEADNSKENRGLHNNHCFISFRLSYKMGAYTYCLIAWVKSRGIKEKLVYGSSFLPCYYVSKIQASDKDLVVNSLGIAWKSAKKANWIQKHRYTLGAELGVWDLCASYIVCVKGPQVDLKFNRHKNVPVSIINKWRHFWSTGYTISIFPRHHLSGEALHTGRVHAFILTSF